MTKAKTKKSCSHSKSFYDSRLGYIKCQYCGKKVETINFGKKKRETGKQARSTGVKKMGYDDKQPDHITQAAKLRTKYDVLRVKAKKEKDPEQKAEIEAQAARTLKRMQEHAAKYNLE